MSLRHRRVYISVAVLLTLVLTVILAGRYLKELALSPMTTAFSPQRLLGESDVVMIAECQGCDTVADLGIVKYWGEEFYYTVVVYKYTPVETLEAPEVCSTVYLWSLARRNLAYGQTDSFVFNWPNSKVLIYGRSLSRNDHPERISLTNLYVTEDGRDRWKTGGDRVDTFSLFYGDSVVVSRILSSELTMNALDSINTQSGACSIFGTDDKYYTHASYCLGKLTFYRSEGSYFVKSLTSQEYLDRLRSLSAR